MKKVKAKESLSEERNKNHTITKVSDEEGMYRIIAEHMEKLDERKQKEQAEKLIQKNAMMIAGPMLKKETLAMCAENPGEWIRLSMAVDSGDASVEVWIGIRISYMCGDTNPWGGDAADADQGEHQEVDEDAGCRGV